jgi:hypothetical protein
MGFGQRAAEHGEILGEDIDLAAVDRAPAGNDAVAGHLLFGHAEIDGAVGDVHVVFFKRAFIEQHLDALARRQLALGMLGVDTLLPAAKPRLGAARFHGFDDIAHASSRRLCLLLSRKHDRRKSPIAQAGRA